MTAPRQRIRRTTGALALFLLTGCISPVDTTPGAIRGTVVSILERWTEWTRTADGWEVVDTAAVRGMEGAIMAISGRAALVTDAGGWFWTGPDLTPGQYSVRLTNPDDLRGLDGRPLRWPRTACIVDVPVGNVGECHLEADDTGIDP